MVGTSNKSVPEMAIDQIHGKFLISSMFFLVQFYVSKLSGCCCQPQILEDLIRKISEGRLGTTKNH